MKSWADIARQCSAGKGDAVRRAVLAIVVLAVLVAGAGAAFVMAGDDGTANDPAVEVYVAIGASDTVGVGADVPEREAWPTVFHSLTVPDARYVNLGVSGSKVEDALTAQLPRALRVDPDLVTVWLGVNDLVALVPVEKYEQQLRRLVGRLTRHPERTVLVGNLPPLDRLPAYTECLPPRQARCRIPFEVPGPEVVDQFVRNYNEAVARVVARSGAILVDLYAAGQQARTAGMEAGHVAADGFHPSTAGHRAIAQAFVQTFRGAVAAREREALSDTASAGSATATAR